jgi:hypothetical protein
VWWIANLHSAKLFKRSHIWPSNVILESWSSMSPGASPRDDNLQATDLTGIRPFVWWELIEVANAKLLRIEP